MLKSQSSFEYFLLMGVLAAVIVLASGGFQKKIMTKLMEYRNQKAGEIGGNSMSAQQQGQP